MAFQFETHVRVQIQKIAQRAVEAEDLCKQSEKFNFEVLDLYDPVKRIAIDRLLAEMDKLRDMTGLKLMSDPQVEMMRACVNQIKADRALITKRRKWQRIWMYKRRNEGRARAAAYI